MKKFLLMTVLAFFSVIMVLSFGACNKQKEETEEADYPVVGLWHAHEEWLDEDPYGRYDGDYVTLDVYYEFFEDGTLRNRLSSTLNGRTLSDTGWVIFNGSWSVEKNVITLSSGRQFVIIDDEFNDIYPKPKMTLHFFKEE